MRNCEHHTDTMQNCKVHFRIGWDQRNRNFWYALSISKPSGKSSPKISGIILVKKTKGASVLTGCRESTKTKLFQRLLESLLSTRWQRRSSSARVTGGSAAIALVLSKKGPSDFPLSFRELCAYSGQFGLCGCGSSVHSLQFLVVCAWYFWAEVLFRLQVCC